MSGHGGARARSGPPPDPDALRRDRDAGASRDRDASQWERFPAVRTAGAPAWPLSPKASARERQLWVREWKRGEANAWQLYGMEIEVAIYVRHLAEVEVVGANATARRLLLSQMDSLGLTMGGRAKNRWIIASPGHPKAKPAEAPDRAETPRPKGAGPSAKARLAGLGVIDGGA